MKVTGLFAIVAASFLPAIQSFAGWDDVKSFPRIEVEYNIVLSSAMAMALQKYDSDFKAWEARNFSPLLRGVYEYKSFHPWKPFLSWQMPAAVIGDFNADNMPDAVLLGRNKTHGRRIALLSGGDGYSVVKFTEDYPLVDPLTPNYKIGNNLEEYLEFITPHKIEANPAYNRPELDLKTDAFKFGVFEKSSGIYIYKDGKFVDYTLSD
ncbi:MAG: hypothetical protein ACYC2I_14030 [Elusimicrobiales bacterium]